MVYSSETLTVGHVQSVDVIHTGQPGRPHKRPNLALLHAAMTPGHHISVSKLAWLIGIHRNMLHHYLKRHNIDYQHTLISDSDLDFLVRHFRSLKPQSGLRYLSGSLNRHGLRIQRQRISESLRRVDPLGRVLRRRTTIYRQQYQVSRPNALWHMDGHHKLIHWGIVIHGVIDGYCQTVSARFSDDMFNIMDFGRLLHWKLIPTTIPPLC